MSLNLKVLERKNEEVFFNFFAEKMAFWRRRTDASAYPEIIGDQDQLLEDDLSGPSRHGLRYPDLHR
jgi:hypothetical protein